MRALLIITSLFLLWTPHTATSAETSDDALAVYEQGLRAMRTGYFTKALENFSHVRNYYRDQPIALKAELAVADLYFKKGDYEQARYAYQEFSTYHPRYEDLDYVVFQMGLSVYKRAPKMAGRDQTATLGAINIWTGFDLRFPESSYLEAAQTHLDRAKHRLASKELYIAQFYKKRGAYRAVHERAERLLRKYPSSTHASQALALISEASHHLGLSSAAHSARERLAEQSPDSRHLRTLDRILEKPPRTQQSDELFSRPYRIRGSGQAPQQGPQN